MQAKLQHHNESFYVRTPTTATAGNVWKSSTIWYNNGNHWIIQQVDLLLLLQVSYFYHWGNVGTSKHTNRILIITLEKMAQASNCRYILYKHRVVIIFNLQQQCQIFICQ